jgi:hypothetical protein
MPSATQSRNAPLIGWEVCDQIEFALQKAKQPMTAMAVDSGDSVMPAGATAAVVRAVAAAYVIAALLIAGGVALIGGSADWWHGFAAATIATMMATIATIPIIAWAMRVGRARPDLSAGAFFAAAGVRAIIALGAGLLAIHRGGYPKTQTLLLVVPYYLALLAAETFVLVRLLWKTGGGGSSSKPTEEKHD